MLHGVDFSGAAQAGHGIWIAEAAVDGDELRIETCESAADRFGVAERTPCLGRLTEFLRTAETVGLDFPFGVPAPVHDRDTWAASVEWVATAATDADEFQAECRSRAREATDGERADLRRETDGPVGALCPYGSHVWKQTFYGIRDVLAPLSRADAVAVRPMQDGGEVSLCEVYPAATLASCDLPAAEYKDGGEPARDRRRTIVEGLEAETPLVFSQGVRAELIDDAGGDALDAVVAALATYRAREADFEPDRSWDSTEGHIYV
ncbi:hypothetical protein BV210_04410 [Halorientalis sp. IM1011]|uniref:DUF429 domain-containing protein n=1 Tax=Halorientalis sp. IM1011 TaxID=1932360 RepID=UPI00097CCA57|nr:DUF429 domain-containing protein [Halorientalis sp. IM1011]AQL42005.1 hypothetical protein BV210_04410 [Halorientalis sp. IM1011]